MAGSGHVPDIRIVLRLHFTEAVSLYFKPVFTRCKIALLSNRTEGHLKNYLRWLTTVSGTF